MIPSKSLEEHSTRELLDLRRKFDRPDHQPHADPEIEAFLVAFYELLNTRLS